MTIDRAVEFMELYTAPGRREHYTPEFVEAHEMAITALRAQQEAEKNEPCEFCNGITIMCGDFRGTGDTICIDSEDTPDFNFCPICGRRFSYRHPPK